MAFSVSMSRPFRSLGRYKFRSLGRYKSAGKHAASKGSAPVPRQESAVVHRPTHAATMPRLTGPHAAKRNVTKKAAA